MWTRVRYFAVFLFIVSCIEPYEFVVKDNARTLVVEAFISDKSFDESLTFPSDGRYFTVKLTYTGDVVNHRPEVATGAAVMLQSDGGEEWAYQEAAQQPGTYQLLDASFEAVRNIKYRVRIALSNDEVYESDWEMLPAVDAPPIGDVAFRETQIQKYVVEAGENVLKTVQGVTANIRVPENQTDGTLHYRWKFTPTWIYKAPLTPASDPFGTCWATNPNYLRDYTLQADNVGGYGKDLFFMETVRNERLFEKFSVLINQYTLSEDNYFFWKEMQEQSTSAIFDTPPYNLKTNFHSVGEEQRAVSGYFGVVAEQATRWYFSIHDLSYHVQNTLRGDCLVVYGPDGPAPECLICTEYSNGQATTSKPLWWPED